MSESRRGIINGAETATSVPCDPRNKRRTIRPAGNTLLNICSLGMYQTQPPARPALLPRHPLHPQKRSTYMWHCCARCLRDLDIMHEFGNDPSYQKRFDMFCATACIIDQFRRCLTGTTRASWRCRWHQSHECTTGNQGNNTHSLVRHTTPLRPEESAAPQTHINSLTPLPHQPPTLLHVHSGVSSWSRRRPAIRTQSLW